MKLSSCDIIVEYRTALKSLRAAVRSLRSESHGKLNCHTWSDGVQHDFCALLSKPLLKSNLIEMLNHEIAEIVRALEAHGVVVDE